MRKKHKEEGHVNHERWLLTYSDLITLLMIFFIVLYTLSKVDADRFRAVADSLNSAIGGGTPSKIDFQTNAGESIVTLNAAGPKTGPGATTQNPVTSDSQKVVAAGEAELKSIQGIKKQVDEFVAGQGLEVKVSTSIEERGLIVSISDTTLFISGSAQVTPEARLILEKISTILGGLSNYIRIEGHTDNAPINTPQFPSNWELSTARAVNVVSVMISKGISPDKLSATGYGEYRPLQPNVNPENMSKNRRVDLVIMRSTFDVTEPQNKPAN